MRDCRCVEALRLASIYDSAQPQLSPLILGAVLVTQAGSMRNMTLVLGTPALTGTDSTILVSSRATARQCLCFAVLSSDALVSPLVMSNDRALIYCRM